jgi:hypothetical protein
MCEMTVGYRCRTWEAGTVLRTSRDGGGKTLCKNTG